MTPQMEGLLGLIEHHKEMATISLMAGNWEQAYHHIREIRDAAHDLGNTVFMEQRRSGEVRP